VTKAYFALWVLLGVVAGIVFLTGNMTMMAVVVFGFISFGMVFMGMMGVLPFAVTHNKPAAEPKPVKRSQPKAAAKVSAVTGWFDPAAVAIKHRHP